MRYYFLLFYTGIILLFCAGCRIDGETLVEGQIVDRDTGDAVKTKGKVAVFDAGGGYKFLFEKETDANGKFAFIFETDGDCILRGFTQQGYSTTWSDGEELKEGRNNKNLKVKMRAPAWVKYKLVNQPPLDTVSKLYVSGFNTDINGQQYVNFYNLSSDTSLIKEISANEERSITWYYYEKGIMIKEAKKIIFPPLDTVEVVINY
jgi:hypothetical protein